MALPRGAVPPRDSLCPQPPPPSPVSPLLPAALDQRIRRRRHRFYRVLLLLMVLLMLGFALPGRWGNLTFLGYLALTLLLCVEVGAANEFRPHPLDRFYRPMGCTVILAQLLWLVTPRALKLSGVPLFLLFTLFIGWSVVRLIHCLSMERRVTQKVVAGALAGYLLLGISGGLVFGVLETIDPGSFLLTQHQDLTKALPALSSEPGKTQVWDVSFMHLNYFAFVSLTTVGYGDIVPSKPAAQMASISLSIIGPLYIAVVMGVLISRLTVQKNEEEREDRRPDVPLPDVRPED